MSPEDKRDMAEARDLRSAKRLELAERVRKYAKQNPEVGLKPLARYFHIDRHTAAAFLKEGQ